MRKNITYELNKYVNILILFNTILFSINTNFRFVVARSDDDGSNDDAITTTVETGGGN